MNKPIKDNFLFYTTNILLILSIVWYYYDGGFEPLIALVAAISTLLADFLLKDNLNKSKDDNTSLLNLPKEYFLMGVFFKKRITIILISISIAYLFCFYFPPQSKIVPDVEIAMYEMENGEVKLGSNKEIQLRESIAEGQLNFNMNIAIRNNEELPLKVVKIELSYPKTLTVISEAKGKIDPNKNFIVYEHDFGSVESSEYYSTVSKVDKISIPISYLTIEKWYLDYDDIPESNVAFIDSTLIPNSDSTVTFVFKIYCENRPPFVKEMVAKLPRRVRTFLDEGDLSYKTKDFEKIKVISSKYEQITGVLIESWLMYRKSKKIEYKKVANKEGVYQYFYVNDVLRKCIVGSGNSVTAQIINRGNDNIADEVIYVFDFPFLKWHKEDFLEN